MTTKTKQAWTPGPWTHEDGEILAPRAVIAQVMGEEDIDAECKANARLISKAPEMAELLRELLTFLPDRNDALNYAAGNEGRVGNIHVAVAKVERLLADLEAV